MSTFSHLITANTWRYAQDWSPDELEIRGLSRGTVISEGVDGESKIALEVPVTAPGYGQLIPGKVAALVYRDGTFEEFLLTEVTDDGAQTGVGRFTGVGYGAILADAGLVKEDLADGSRSFRFERVELTATQHLTSTVLDLLASVGIDFLELGDVTVTGVRTITYDGLNGLEALEAIIQAWGAEYHLRPDPANSRILLDVVPQRNAGVFGGDLRLGQNAALSRTRSRLEQVNAVTPRLADGSTIAANRWAVTAVAASVLTLADPNGGDGPIREDGQLDGLYLENAAGTRRERINSSDASGQTVQVGATNAFTYSEDLSQAAYVKDAVTATTNATAAPDGATTAERFLETTANQYHGVYRSISGLGVGSTNAFSCYVKAEGRTRVSFYAGGGPDLFGAIFDLVSAGSVVNSLMGAGGVLASATIESVGNDWYRLGIVGVRGVQTNATLLLVAHAGTGTPTLAAPAYVGDVTKGFYSWGWQAETGASVLGVYTPTTTAAANSAAGVFTVADRCRVCRTSAGADLTELVSPSSIASYRRRAAALQLPALAGINNLLPNPVMATYTSPSAAPDGWSAVSTVTFTRTTTAGFTALGGYSARCQTAGDGRGLASPLAPIPVTAVRPYVCGTVSVRVDTGNIRVELVATDGTSTWVFPSSDVQVASPSFRGALTTMVIPGIDLHALGATSARMRVVQHGTANADFYVDAAQLVVSNTPQEVISEGYDANRAWQAGNQHLDLYAPLRVRYATTVADLFRLDGTRYPYQALVLGGTHRTIDPSLGVADGVRLVARQRSVLVEAETRVTLSNRPEDLISLQARRDPVARTAGNVGEVLLPSGARYASNVSMASSNRASSTGAGFTSGDIGKTIWVFGAGTEGGIHKSTITAINTVNQVTMANNYATFGSGLTAIWGTAEDVLTLAAEIGGRRAGATIAGETGVLNANAKDFQSRNVARFFAKPIVSDADTLDHVPNGSTFIKVIPFVTIVANQSSITGTTVVVAVTASDPSGGAAPSISHNGGGAVTGSGPYTIARPAAGSGPLLVTFTASKTGRVSQTVTLTAPEQTSGGGTPPPSIDAFYVTSYDNSADTITTVWTVSNPPSGATYRIRRLLDHPDVSNDWVIVTSSASTPYASATGIDMAAKGTADSILVRATFDLQMRNSGGTVVATATCFVNVHAIYTP